MADSTGKHDIDFDELDKAVNSLMGKVGDETLDDESKTQTLEVTTTLKPDDKVQYDQIGKVAKKIGDETLVTDGEVELVEDLSTLPEKMELPATALATPAVSVPVTTPATPARPAVPRPNNGRFMDMVHPGADMRAAATPPVVETAPTTPAPTPAIAPQPEVVAPAVAVPSGPEAPLTPFLPDAKVEKRPLGGGSSLAVPVAMGSAKFMGAQPPESIDFSSSTQSTAPASLDTQLPPNPDSTPDDPLAEQTLTKIEASEIAAPVEVSETDAPSIEKVESGDTEGLKNGGVSEQATTPVEAPGGAIYDVNSYHQPLNHPAKRKSGWSVVIIIVVIIILAVVAAGGAYLYFGLPA